MYGEVRTTFGLLLLSLIACTAPLGRRPQGAVPVGPTSTSVPPSPRPPSLIPRPSAAATPTISPIPSATLTPGRITFTDDFSAKTGAWLDCHQCRWEDGKLMMGPYSPAASIADVYTRCGPCGSPRFFRMAVDVRHIDGETDRSYGLMMGLTRQALITFEISPLYLFTIGLRYDLAYQSARILNLNWKQVLSGLVRPGHELNRIEIKMNPTGPATADLYFRVNGRNAFVLYNQPVEPGGVGLIMDSFAVRAAFDNFEFEELVP
jgi:hypothetical protein